MVEVRSVIKRRLCLGCEICCPSTCPEILTVKKDRIARPGEEEESRENESAERPSDATLQG